MRLQWLLALILVVPVIFTTCSKDNEEDEIPYETLALAEVGDLVDVPEALKNNDDPFAQLCVGYIEQASDFSDFTEFMIPPENAESVSKKAGPVTYKWTEHYDNQNTITIYWTFEEGANQYNWDLDIQFNDGEVYDYITAWQLKDKTEGEIRFNYNFVCALYSSPEFCTDLFWIYHWEKHSDGSVSLEYYVTSESSEVTYAVQYIVTVNPDGSGSVVFYNNDIMVYDMRWNADGSGSWTAYDSEGNEAGSGTWSA